MSYIDVKEFPGLRVEAFASNAGVTLFYTGELEHLLAAAIVPASALVRWVRGATKGRVDCDGDRVTVDLYFGSGGGVPRPRARVILRKSLAKGLRLPGALDAWRKLEADQARFGPERVVELALAPMRVAGDRLH